MITFCRFKIAIVLILLVSLLAMTPRPGSPGTLRWGGVCNTTFFIDPKEQLIGISMGQLFPGEIDWAEKFQQLVYAAVDD
jgi:CubicO group peptidase (beta-lactamase class C family)